MNPRGPHTQLIAVIAIALSVSSCRLEAPATKPPEMMLGNSEFQLEVVCDKESRTLGLSGRKYLDKDRAMLFVFDRPDRHGIWMKAMNFAIDILWLDTFKQVIHIERNVAPETYPKIFYSPHPALYALETSAGAAENIVPGMTAVFKHFPSRCQP